ncbi:MAG: sigma-E factor negative regulatory protein [Proteobacteria bacterium]|nr:sigma-E factor negative regulatory protein [Pseudomonadota bacterium]
MNEHDMNRANNPVNSPDPELLEQLSAFMDGELDGERSRFLLQRLAHDETLRARWERWQLQAGALRKMAQPLPAGFAQAVAQAIDANAEGGRGQPTIRFAGRRRRWLGGAALAASLAVAGVFAYDMLHVHQSFAPPKLADIARPAPVVMPIARTALAMPEPTIQLPIPVHSGVVVAFRQPLRPSLAHAPVAPSTRFEPFPQPYAIDPELAAYLQGRKAGSSRDVFRDDAANNGSGAVHAVSWSETP